MDVTWTWTGGTSFLTQRLEPLPSTLSPPWTRGTISVCRLTCTAPRCPRSCSYRGPYSPLSPHRPARNPTQAEKGRRLCCHARERRVFQRPRFSGPQSHLSQTVDPLLFKPPTLSTSILRVSQHLQMLTHIVLFTSLNCSCILFYVQFPCQVMKNCLFNAVCN